MSDIPLQSYHRVPSPLIMSATLLSAAATSIEQHGHTELASDFFLATMPSDNDDWPLVPIHNVGVAGQDAGSLL